MLRFSKFATALAILATIAVGNAFAGPITTVADTNANDLANALTSGGVGGITITNATLDFNTNGNASSSGIYSTAGGNKFNLTGSGIVLSSGDAVATGTSGPFQQSITTNFGQNATAAQSFLLNQVASAPQGWHDVTALTVTFDVDKNTSAVFFDGVFTSAEYPVFVNQFIDGFGLFLNGTNIATTAGLPTNINHPGMVNTGFPAGGGGVDGSAFQETPVGGVLVNDGAALLHFSGLVTPGSTGNTLTFIVGDANDNVLDTTVFIKGLGNAPPPNDLPEPASITLLGLSLAGAAGYRLRRRKTA